MNVKKIALTGGIACGKSLLARFLREAGVETCDADDVVHALEAPGGEAVSDIVAHFGAQVMAADGGIDRAALAAQVFANPAARRRLEELLFPRVRTTLNTWLAQAPQGVLRVAIIPLLFESHWHTDYDIIIAVVSSEALQIRRMMETRGYSRAEAEARLAAQMPVDEKAARADYVVRNDSTPDALRQQVIKLVAYLHQV